MHVALVGAELQEDLTVRYLRGALEAAGHEVTQFAFNGECDLGALADRLGESRAPLLGMSLVFTSRAREFARLASRARERGYDGHITVGGHFAAFNAEALLRDVPAIDSVVTGEGELILAALATKLDDLPGVAGLVWRADDGAIVHNPASPKPSDLDVLPRPTRRRPFDRYLGLPLANMLGSRGCAHGCSFCSIAAWHRMCGGARLRLRGPERVAEEMADLFAEGVRIFNFHDDNFVLDNRRLMFDRIDRMRRTLKRRGVGRIAFSMKARPDEIDRGLLEPLVEMGLFRVFLGIEAGTAQALVQLGRGQLLEDNERALALMGELGLHASFNLLLWNPGSTLEDVSLNVDWLRDHSDNPMNFSRTEVYAGTPLERQLRDSGRLRGDYWGYDYRVADARAEQAFQLAYAAFAERNFGATSLHHSAMRLDYEYQLLAHFLGHDVALRRQVKDYVRAVNLDTCRHLTEIMRAVAGGLGDSIVFRARVVAEVAAKDTELDARAQRILNELHQAAAGAHSGRASPYSRSAATAALVAALSIGSGAACDDDRGNRKDSGVAAASAGPPPAAPPSPEPAPVPAAPPVTLEPTPAPPQVPELGRWEAIRGQFGRRALGSVASAIHPPRDTVVELLVGADGHVTEASVRVDGLAVAAEARLIKRLRALVFTGPEVASHRFVITVTAAQIRAAQDSAALAVPLAAPVKASPDFLKRDWEYTHPREAAHRPNLEPELFPTKPE